MSISELRTFGLQNLRNEEPFISDYRTFGLESNHLEKQLSQNFVWVDKCLGALQNFKKFRKSKIKLDRTHSIHPPLIKKTFFKHITDINSTLKSLLTTCNSVLHTNKIRMVGPIGLYPNIPVHKAREGIKHFPLRCLKPDLHFERKYTPNTQTIVRTFSATNADLHRSDRA